MAGWVVARKNGPLFSGVRNKARREAIRRFVNENCPDQISKIDEITKKNDEYQDRFFSFSLAASLAVFFNRPNTLRRLAEDIDVQGLEILDKYRDEGVIAFGYHIGPISVVPVMMTLLGYDTTFLLRPDTIKRDLGLTIEQINARLKVFGRNDEIGEISGIDSFSSFSIVQMKKRLRKGQILFIYPDTVHTSSADCVAVPIFNSEIAGHLGVAKLYRMTSAKIVPIDFGWHDDGRQYFHVKPPLEIHDDLSDEQIVRRVYQGMETRLRVDLAQWLRVRIFDLLKYQSGE